VWDWLIFARGCRARFGGSHVLRDSLSIVPGCLRLYLTDNRLESLPPEIGQLKRLRKLQASFNNLRLVLPRWWIFEHDSAGHDRVHDSLLNVLMMDTMSLPGPCRPRSRAWENAWSSVGWL
jgi:hypothetical protein